LHRFDGRFLSLREEVPNLRASACRSPSPCWPWPQAFCRPGSPSTRGAAPESLQAVNGYRMVLRCVQNGGNGWPLPSQSQW